MVRRTAEIELQILLSIVSMHHDSTYDQPPSWQIIPSDGERPSGDGGGKSHMDCKDSSPTDSLLPCSKPDVTSPQQAQRAADAASPQWTQRAARATTTMPSFSSPLELQEWMAGQLNSLPWTKIDIDCRHMHSHAGIVVRIPDRYPVKDGVHYLVEQIVWE